MGDLNDTQVVPEFPKFIEHELTCPFCEKNLFSVETVVMEDHNIQSYYSCSCGNSWDVIGE
jgi:transcription elongation factor Elf1